MYRLRLFLSMLVVAALGLLAVHEPALAQNAKKKRAEAKAEALKAKAEAEAKAKAEAEAKANQAQDAAKASAAVTSDTAKLQVDTVALAKLIDAAIQKRLDAAQVPASPLCSDEEFLRRVYLDITGTIPSAAKAIEFLDSKEPNKRAKLIDELLASPGYGRHMADIWAALLVQRSSENRRVNFAPLAKELEKRFNDGMPWNQMVYDILTASGESDKNGNTLFYLGNPSVDKLTDQTAKLFLGVQLQCAQCHNHPFTGWKQTEYWGMAAFFMKVQLTNPTANPKTGKTPTVNEGFAVRPKNLPESAKMVPPKFLLGEQLKPITGPARPTLAKWITQPGNPFFARAMVNRIWAQFFGRGFVNPIDDMHQENPASHPELLQALADEFTRGGFDLKGLIRGICLSQTYQRSAKTVPGNENDEELFSHMSIKALTPEQLFDSLTAVLGNLSDNSRGNRNLNANLSPRDRFVAFFSVSDDPKPTEYEQGIPQALRLMNSKFTSLPAIREYTKAGSAPQQVIEKLYLTALSRRPTSEELTKLLNYTKNQSDNATAYSDILWALINSSEFSLNR